MDSIEFEDFKKLDIRVAKIIKAEEIEGADKLLKLTLDVGSLEENGQGERVVVAGIKEWYKPEDLVGKIVPYLANLEPRKLLGIMSQGMLLAAEGNDPPSYKATGGHRAILLHPDRELKPGAKVR